jgi:hypothetical protein
MKRGVDMKRGATPRFKILTVDEVRQKYWDPYRKQGRGVFYFVAQTFGEPPEGNFRLVDEFIPDGNMRTRDSKSNRSWITHDWLSKSRDGPYYSTSSSSVFHYLTGTFTVHGPSDTDPGPGELQICSNPLNGLSTDCLDEVHCWVPST